MNSVVEIRQARLVDVPRYVELGRIVQAKLISRGLTQYVPAAHDEYAAVIRARVAAGVLFAVWDNDAATGFFSLDPMPSPWWPTDDGVSALYLAGMVVAEEARGRGIGGHIIGWCVEETQRRGYQFLRLDCHADNAWLCAYYEAQSFSLQGCVEQHPGYNGGLYQRPV